MKRYNSIYILTLTLILSYSGYGQNWQAVDTSIAQRPIINAAYTDTVDDAIFFGGMKETCNKCGQSLFEYRNGKFTALDSFKINQYSIINSIKRFNDTLVVGGNFKMIGDTTIKTVSVAAFKNGNFHPMNKSMGLPFQPVIHHIGEFENQLVFSGDYYEFGGIPANGVVSYDNGIYSGFSEGVLDYARPIVYCFQEYKGKLYAGGHFWTGDAKTTDNKGLQVWDGESWNGLDGWRSKIDYVPGAVYDMAVYQGELYIAGEFSKRGGGIANHIVKFDGDTFYEVGNFSSTVEKLLVHNGRLYAAGWFGLIDGLAANKIAHFDGNKWCNFSLTDKFKGGILDMDFYHDTLFVAGAFDTLNGQPTNPIIKWIGNPNMTDSCGTTVNIKRVGQPTHA